MPQVPESPLPKECLENVSTFICFFPEFGFLAATISVPSGASVWGIIQYVPSLRWICVFDKPFNWNMSSFDMFGPAKDEPCSKKRT